MRNNVKPKLEAESRGCFFLKRAERSRLLFEKKEHRGRNAPEISIYNDFANQAICPYP